MRRARILGNLVLAVAIVVLAVAFSPAIAAANVGSTWENPIDIPVKELLYTNYRTLESTGDVVFYRLQLDRPQYVRVSLGLSQSSSEKFVPRVVVFKPQSSVIGPLLPFPQPPKTIGLVYPLVAPRAMFEPYTQTTYDVRLDTNIALNVAGTYYFAVYDAGSAPGEYRFSFDRGSPLVRWQDAWSMPMHWWRAQTFAGFSWQTLILPTMVVLGLWLVWLRLDHHQLHPHKRYPPGSAKTGHKA